MSRKSTRAAESVRAQLLIELQQYVHMAVTASILGTSYRKGNRPLLYAFIFVLKHKTTDSFIIRSSNFCKISNCV